MATRPYVLTIAGLDPSGGAGILADAKVFEQHEVQGMAVCTAITFQNENEFSGLVWVPFSDMKHQIQILFNKYHFEYIKIGLIQGLEELEILIDFLHAKDPGIRIVWDPIMKASAGYDFHKQIDQAQLVRILKKIFLLVPNIPEMDRLNPDGVAAAVSAKKLSKYCHVFLKGGHSKGSMAEDILFENDQQYVFSQDKIEGGEKHGSGCVLSASLVSNMAKGYTLIQSCRKAKNYTASFLSSNKTLLGYHYR